MKRKTLFLSALLALSLTTAQAEMRDGHFWLQFNNRHILIDQAQEQMTSWFNLPDGSSFEQVKDYTDRLGIRHQDYQQYVAGVKVNGGIVKVHGRNGLVTSANGYVLERSQAPKQVRRLARNGAKTADGRILVLVETAQGTRYAYQSRDFLTGDDLFTDVETGETLLRLTHRYTADMTTTAQSLYSGKCQFTVNQLSDGTYAMADSARNIYTIDARYASNDLSDYYLDFDGQTGNPKVDVKKYFKDNCPALTSKNADWSVMTIDSININSMADHNADSLTTVIASYQVGIQPGTEHSKTEEHIVSMPATLNLQSIGLEAGFPNNVILSWYDSDRQVVEDTLHLQATEPGSYSWKNVDANGQVTSSGTYYISRKPHFAVDVHWGMEQTYDYYKTRMGRDSYDGKGSPIYNVVYTPSEDFNDIIGCPADNAAAETEAGNSPFMIYGLGDIDMKPVVALDVMAHEFTHIITSETADLEYSGEPGALNESFSDIIGIAVKQWAKKCPDNWLIGDEIMKDHNCLRDMIVPENGWSPQPSVYKGQYWVNTNDKNNDNGGVHTNSGVQNHWFYLLCEGGDYTDPTGTVSHFDGVGIDRGVQIAYRSLSEVLTPKSDYKDAVKGSILATTDLFGDDAPELKAVRGAWAAVGFTDILPSGITNVVSVPHVSADGIYTLSGVRMNQTTTEGLPSGIYIQNGRKLVVK